MPLPSMMRHIVAREPGPPDVLTMTDGPVPQPKAGEVLIEVAAAGVNRPDCLQRAGAYPPPADASPIIGLEVAGTHRRLRRRRAGLARRRCRLRVDAGRRLRGVLHDARGILPADPHAA